MVIMVVMTAALLAAFAYADGGTLPEQSAAEKLAAGEGTDPYELFLELAVKRGGDAQSG